jgi:hypothetical protein
MDCPLLVWNINEGKQATNDTYEKPDVNRPV